MYEKISNCNDTDLQLVPGAPKPPKNVTVTWLDARELGLRLTPGFHGGKPQTFHIKYRQTALGDEEEVEELHMDATFEVSAWFSFLFLFKSFGHF
jgi:hypothetical protein